MTRPPDAPRIIPASRTFAMLVTEMEARHAREWQDALRVAAEESGIDLERFAFDQATRSWIDQSPPAQPESVEATP